MPIHFVFSTTVWPAFITQRTFSRFEIADIGQRVALDGDEIREEPRRHGAETLFHPKRCWYRRSRLPFRRSSRPRCPRHVPALRFIVGVLVEMLAPYKGRVFDPCCGSGIFVQSEKFFEAHGGRIQYAPLSLTCP